MMQPGSKHRLGAWAAIYGLISTGLITPNPNKIPP